VPLLERYAAVRPVDPMPHRLLAQLYLGRKVEGRGPEAAIEHLEYLDAREQKSPAYAAELARRYAALGRWDEAAAKAERATQVAPYNAEMRELAATVAIKRSDFDTAERHLWALTQIEPDRKVHTDRLEALKRLRAGAK
jgi:tetratricopeptide (TPR) repeat protein